MANNNNSLLAGLQGLIWSAIIGVASFQIIAPDVWGYIHDALAIPYKSAYWIFTLSYFLSLPVFMLVWLLFNKRGIGEGGLAERGRGFAEHGFAEGGFAERGRGVAEHGFAEHGFAERGFGERGLIFRLLFAFICVQTLGTAVTLRWYFPAWFYSCIFITNVVCCGSLLVFYAKVAWRRVVAQHIRQYYGQLVLFTVLSFVVLFAIQFVYIIQWESYKSASLYLGGDQPSFDAGNRGFALLGLKDTLDQRMTAVEGLRDSIEYAHAGDTAGSDGVMVDTMFTGYCAALIDLRRGIGRLSGELADPARAVLTDTIDSIAARVPVLTLGGAPLEHYRADLREIGFLRSILQRVDAKVNAESQAQLGLQLRSVQIKGIILLVTLFFTMLSLYIYLSVNQRLASTTLDVLNDRKRLGEDVTESAVIEQEKVVARATAVTNSLWIGLTVIVWLLVPLFKPVTDADIDTREIYKIHTLSNFVGAGTASSGAGTAGTGATGAGVGSAADGRGETAGGATDSVSR